MESISRIIRDRIEQLQKELAAYLEEANKKVYGYEIAIAELAMIESQAIKAEEPPEIVPEAPPTRTKSKRTK
jgi:hypothetical protein